MRDITLADTFYHLFTTRIFATGIPGTLAGSPVVSAYENDSATQITAGITLGADHDSVTGLNLLTIVATGANGYEAGKDYSLVITTGTVSSVSVVGEVIGQFSIGRSAAAVDLANGTDGLGAIKADTAAVLVDTADIQPNYATATALATVDTVVDGIQTDLDNGTDGLGAIKADTAAILVDTGTTLQAELDGIQADTEDLQTQIGTAGAGLTAINLPNQTMDIVGNITGNLSGSVGSVTGAVGSVTGAVGSVTGAVGSVTGNVGGDVQGNVDGTVATVTTNSDMRGTDSAATAANLATVDTVVDAIKVITDALGATAAARLALSAGQIIVGTVDTGSFASTTTEFEADDITEATADHYKSRVVLFTSGALAGQATDITVYALSGANGHFTCTALTEAPGNNDTFIIV